MVMLDNSWNDMIINKVLLLFLDKNTILIHWIQRLINHTILDKTRTSPNMSCTEYILKWSNKNTFGNIWIFLSKFENKLWIRLTQILYISDFFLHNTVLNIWIHLVYKYCLVTILFRKVIGKNVFSEIRKIRFFVWQKKPRPEAIFSKFTF